MISLSLIMQQTQEVSDGVKDMTHEAKAMALASWVMSLTPSLADTRLYLILLFRLPGLRFIYFHTARLRLIRLRIYLGYLRFFQARLRGDKLVRHK